jgi:hypothetical protein
MLFAGVVTTLNRPGFRGIVKQRYEDFHVNEVAMDGSVVKLTSMKVPLDPGSPTPTATSAAAKRKGAGGEGGGGGGGEGGGGGGGAVKPNGPTETQLAAFADLAKIVGQELVEGMLSLSGIKVPPSIAPAAADDATEGSGQPPSEGSGQPPSEDERSVISTFNPIGLQLFSTVAAKATHELQRP